jgi:hypothetical protein
MSEHVTNDAKPAKKRKPTAGRKPRKYTFQLTTLLDPAVAEALALDAEIERTSPSQHSRKLITEGLVARGRLRHPVLAEHPELDPSK